MSEPNDQNQKTEEQQNQNERDANRTPEEQYDRGHQDRLKPPGEGTGTRGPGSESGA